MKARFIVTVLTVALCLQSTTALSILFFFPISSYSHRIPVWPLAEGLASKGHNVTFVSPYPPKEPNLKIMEFTPKEIAKFMEDNDEGPQAFFMRQNKQVEPFWWLLPDWGLEICELFVNSADTQEWLKASKFDLIVIDTLFNDCGLGLAHYFKAKHMAFATSAPFMWHYDTFGIPHEASWIPDMQWHYSEDMTFMERFWTTWNTIVWDFHRQYNYFPKLHRILSEGLNASDLPPLREIEKNVSLVLLNSHFSEEFPRALPPLVVPIGGMHIKESKKSLPKDFEDFIAKGNQGFIYISFGSMVQLSEAPKEISSAFFDAVKRVKDLNFIWKWDDEVPVDIPPNVLMQKWMPQQEILAHKKIKGFVTHGGLMSTQEAVYHGIPLISMPVCAEQDYNAERVHSRGIGIKLEITTITADQLVDAVFKITNDQRYKLKMAEVSKKFRDRPMKPVESAMWWTEYILRHDDTSHLKPKSIHQNWFTRRLLDVYLISLAILLAAAIIFYKAVKILLSLCFAKTTPPQKRKQN